MIIVKRYITKELLYSLISISLILMIIFITNQFIHYVKDAQAGHFSIKIVMILVILKLPQLLAALLPLSLYVSILLLYGKMYTENEMTVLFSCGFSLKNLLYITMKFALYVSLFTALLMFWLVPKINSYVEKLMTKGALSPTSLIKQNSFQASKNGKWIFYVEKVNYKKHILHNIFAAEEIKNKNKISKMAILYAASAHTEFNKKTKDLFILFQNGNRYVGRFGTNMYTTIKFNTYGFRLPQTLGYNHHRDDALSTLKLIKNISNNGINAEFQWRCSIPIMTFILALIAVPISRANNRTSRYIKLAPAILLYIIYGNFMFLSRTWLRNGTTSHLLGMWWIHIVMFFCALILIINQIGFKRFFFIKR